MTMAPEEPKTETPVPEGHVKLTIDGEEVIAPKGELLIRTAERLGTVIPRFCDHPLLDPAGACRQCLVEVEMGGRPMPKPQASCTMTVADGMVVKTQLTSPVADKAQQGVMELLLINHPLDCPVCDKGGECPLQNQAMAHGRTDSRFVDKKRTFPKPLPISTQVLLDRERCVLCQRCTRFSAQIAGDPFIDLLERGAHQQIGTAETADVLDMASKTSSGKPFQSYFSGNTIQICPVGALTSAQYRFRSRPFDLVSSPSVCEHCSSGCAERTDFRRGKVMRKLAGNDPDVNEEWICDRGRFAFRYAQTADRIRRPLVRENGELREASWTEALRVAASGLAAARDSRGVGVLTGGRLTLEDAYAYSKFARVALRTNDIDFRARAHSAEELSFLASHVVGTTPSDGVTFAAIEKAPTVLCVAFEPEDEAPIVFLRLRKAARKRGAKIVHLGQWTTSSVRKTFGELLACLPGSEPAALNALAEHAPDLDAALAREGAVILVGERAAEVPGLFSAVHALSTRTGARVAWIPRRAGDRGALEAGAVPNLLPGGRPVTDAAARAEISAAWGVEVPSEPGRDTTGILAALADGVLGGVLVGGVDPGDLPDPDLARRALARAEFVVSLELRPSEVTERADVVLPIAPDVEKAGSYVNWEGRRRAFDITIENSGALPDARVLDTLAVEMDADLFTQTPAAAYGDFSRLPAFTARVDFTPVEVGAAEVPGRGQARLSTWRQLIDNGSLQVDEPHLAGTARPPVARVAASVAEELGETVTVSTSRGSVTLPVEVADLPDGVVWLPANSDGSRVRTALGAGHGAVVSLEPGGER
ncbi:NADH-quinone oxidoreductase subunit G [Amycolatopsis bartoniae]|uniref:NADH-quinone oxidoreductase n=1 Tax=Amycolatopsis bartoniae TaxID=941986 RepID=A0A8H9J3H7_9PSEU|nr:NADH-quinone oxidoreductase subunit G [Amycolatopsis bartoniae]MBB2933695.1 NADH-quinone oxidoreductase subunit G [Amycolatopsis bartoniae]TVT10851.1 NADH-quinone oxidoreductase subunit G [Amycolatopsis bartoniae]GHF72262.1 NADH-quinone oxidoreductase [Amycolatopsis bartoniae]